MGMRMDFANGALRALRYRAPGENETSETAVIWGTSWALRNILSPYD
jgi:hypothetical protein